MNHSDIVSWIDRDFPLKHPKRKPYRHFKLIAIGLIIIMVITASAGLISYYARIQADIDVQAVIFVDGMEQPTITDSFDLGAGYYRNITHNFSNQHTIYDYNLYLNITSIDEGLNLTFWNTTTPVGNIGQIITIPKQSYYDVNFSYYLLPNADPSENLTSIVTVEYESVT